MSRKTKSGCLGDQDLNGRRAKALIWGYLAAISRLSGHGSDRYIGTTDLLDRFDPTPDNANGTKNSATRRQAIARAARFLRQKARSAA